MKTRSAILTAFAAVVLLAGCATDNELSQKEKDRMAREQQREALKQQKAQEKMMRDNTNTGQRSRLR